MKCFNFPHTHILQLLLYFPVKYSTKLLFLAKVMCCNLISLVVNPECQLCDVMSYVMTYLLLYRRRIPANRFDSSSESDDDELCCPRAESKNQMIKSLPLPPKPPSKTVPSSTSVEAPSVESNSPGHSQPLPSSATADTDSSQRSSLSSSSAPVQSSPPIRIQQLTPTTASKSASSHRISGSGKYFS